MSLNHSSFLIGLVCFSTALVLPQLVSAGEITRPDATQSFQWKSTKCPLPIKQASNPKVSSQDRLMLYARDIEIYIDCIKREAQSDFEDAQKKMQMAIERDLEKQTKIMNDMMLQAAKTMR